MNAQECQAKIEECEQKIAEWMLAAHEAQCDGNLLLVEACNMSINAWTLSAKAYRLSLKRLVN
jgi:hypothetical protein